MADGVCTFTAVQLEAGPEGLTPELQDLMSGGPAPYAIIEAVLTISWMDIPPTCVLVFDFEVHSFP
jgi:hypothetical protein